MSDEVNAKLVTVADVRLALMDYMERNIPLYTCHLTDDQLQTCIDWAMDYINEATPRFEIPYEVATFKNKHLLIKGAVVEALRLTALIELRGEMNYSDGGTQSSIYYKSPQFTALRQEAQASFEDDVRRIKRQINVENCYGGTW